MPGDDATNAAGAARSVSREVLAPAAADVDAEQRFPAEGVAALREAGLLEAAVPIGDGGLGLTVDELVAVAEDLGRGCGSTAMVWAMHQIQVASLVRHGRTAFLEQYVRDLVSSRPLLGSATSEVGIGGDLMRSRAALERLGGDSFRLVKEAATVSYGASADGMLATARRDPGAAPHDQVLVLLLSGDGLEREQTGTWNVMGMRGTVSPPFKLTVTAPSDRILSDPFEVIAVETMVPLSHLLWSACWLGIAGDAMRRAAATARGGEDHRLAEADAALRTVRAMLTTTAAAYADLLPGGRFEPNGASVRERLGPDFTVAMNVLKLKASVDLVRVAELALELCGIGGYREDGPASVARHLRDLYSARLMVSNRRLLETNAQLTLVTGRQR